MHAARHGKRLLDPAERLPDVEKRKRKSGDRDEMVDEWW